MLFIFSFTVSGADQQYETFKRLEKKVNISFQQASLHEQLDWLGRTLKVKMSYDSTEFKKKKSRIVEKQIRGDQALYMILSRNNLAYVVDRAGVIHFVKPEKWSWISGFVYDAETNEPVSYANVFLENTSLGSTSDSSGYYEMKNIPPGLYRLSARLMGYRPKFIYLNLNSGRRLEIDFYLKTDVLAMDEIVATADRERKIIQPQMSKYTFGARQFSIVPSYGETDVFRTLDMLPGVVSTNDFKSQLYIRGGNSDQNLVLLDGAVMYNPFHFSGILSAFDVDAIHKVDFYAGGFGAEYGGRLSSVVDIKSRTGRDRWRNQLSLSPLSAKLMTELPLWSWGNFMISGRRSYVNGIAKELGGSVQPDFYDGITNLTIRPTKYDTVTLSSFYGRDDVVLQISDKDELMSNQNWCSALNYKRRFGERLFVKLNTSYGEFSTGVPDPLEKSKSKLNRMKDVHYGLGLNYVFSPGFALKAGGEYRESDIYYKTADPIVAEMIFDERVYEQAAYIQAFMRPGKWTFETGLRANRYAKNGGFMVEPRVNVYYDLYNFLTLKAGYGRYSQNLVTIYNENDTYNPVDIWLPPTDDLKAAMADHFILGANYKTPNFIASAEAYYRDYRNLTQYNRERLYAFDPYFVQGSGYSYGLDLSAQYLWKDWQVWASYGFLKAIKRLPFQYPEPGIDEFAPRYDRRHSLNVLLDCHPNEKWEVSARFVYGSGMPFSFMIGAYQRWSTFVINTPSDYVTPSPDDRRYYLTAIQSERDAFRFPDYHRLDISVKYTIRSGRVMFKPYLQIINAYNQGNVLYYDVYAKPHYSVGFLPFVGFDFVF